MSTPDASRRCIFHAITQQIRWSEARRVAAFDPTLAFGVGIAAKPPTPPLCMELPKSRDPYRRPLKHGLNDHLKNAVKHFRDNFFVLPRVLSYSCNDVIFSHLYPRLAKRPP